MKNVNISMSSPPALHTPVDMLPPVRCISVTISAQFDNEYQAVEYLNSMTEHMLNINVAPGVVKNA